jgi:hypothetical protein
MTHKASKLLFTARNFWEETSIFQIDVIKFNSRSSLLTLIVIHSLNMSNPTHKQPAALDFLFQSYGPEWNLATGDMIYIVTPSYTVVWQRYPVR